LADRTKAIDLLNHELEPAFTNVEDKLRADMSVPRSS